MIFPSPAGEEGGTDALAWPLRPDMGRKLIFLKKVTYLTL
jgi:hypothetical protein